MIQIWAKFGFPEFPYEAQGYLASYVISGKNGWFVFF